MKKYAKKHLKDEKRILRLMYRKGIFDLLRIDLKNLGWEYLLTGKMLRKRRGKRKYSYRECLPELHLFTYDYWGECDSKSVISILIDHLYWVKSESVDEHGFPVNSKYFKRAELIKYLSDLPKTVSNTRINTFLKRSQE